MLIRVLYRGLLKRRGTGNNVDQLVGNDSLSSSVVQNGVLVDHIGSVLGSVVHSVSSSRDLSSVALGHGGVDGVGQREVGKVLDNVVLELVLAELGGVLNGLGGVGLLHDGLKRDTGQDLVVDNLNVVVLGVESKNLVSNVGSLLEGGGLLTGSTERQTHLLGVRSAELGLDLLTDSNNVNELLAGLKVEQLSSNGSGKLGVDGTTQTLIGGDNNPQSLLDVLRHSGLGVLENLLGGLVVDLGGGHGSLGLTELGGGNNLHGVGNLLNVLNGLESHLDLSKSGIVSGLVLDHRSDWP